MWHRWSDDTLQSFRESSKMKMRIELTEIDEKLLNNVGIVIRVWRSFFLFSNEKYSRIDKICWFCKQFLKNQRAFLCNLEIFKLKEMYSSTQPPPPPPPSASLPLPFLVIFCPPSLLPARWHYLWLTTEELPYVWNFCRLVQTSEIMAKKSME